MCNHQELEETAKYYETEDTSSELESAVWDDTAVVDPMVTTSLRLPKPVMDAVRRAAAQRGVRPTQLMREWIEARVTLDDSKMKPRG